MGNLPDHGVVQAIARADAHDRLLVQDVEFGDGQGIGPVQFDGVTCRHRIEPSATARPAGSRAVLVAPFPHAGTGLARFLGGERSCAYTGAISLAHQQHPLDGPGGKPKSGAGTADRGRRGGNVGIGAEIQVQHGSLGTLQEDVFPLFPGLVEDAPCVGNVRSQLPAVLQVFQVDVVQKERRPAVQLGEHGVFGLHQIGEATQEHLLVQEVRHTHA